MTGESRIPLAALAGAARRAGLVEAGFFAALELISKSKTSSVAEFWRRRLSCQTMLILGFGMSS
jgi:hypothetical protein